VAKKQSQAISTVGPVFQNTANTIGIHKRGCGWPVAGGSYISVEPEGFQRTPIWEFVIDPTYHITDDQSGLPVSDMAIAMVLKSRGTTDKNGAKIYDLYDWIGGTAYPNPLDWILEVEKLGFHQKVNPYHLTWLSPESMYFAIHARAGIVNPTTVYHYHEQYRVWEDSSEQAAYPKCPGNIPEHMKFDKTLSDLSHLGTCPGLFFNDVIKGKSLDNPGKGVPARKREMPSFTWKGFEALKDIEHCPAIFFKLPIGRMAQFLVYEDTQDHSEEEALKVMEQMDERLRRVKIVPLNGV
jgi:hypothetical protein